MQRELSIFIDESGDFGEAKERPSYYLVGETEPDYMETMAILSSGMRRV